MPLCSFPLGTHSRINPITQLERKSDWEESYRKVLELDGQPVLLEVRAWWLLPAVQLAQHCLAHAFSCADL